MAENLSGFGKRRLACTLSGNSHLKTACGNGIHQAESVIAVSGPCLTQINVQSDAKLPVPPHPGLHSGWICKSSAQVPATKWRRERGTSSNTAVPTDRHLRPRRQLSRGDHVRFYAAIRTSVHASCWLAISRSNTLTAADRDHLFGVCRYTDVAPFLVTIIARGADDDDAASETAKPATILEGAVRPVEMLNRRSRYCLPMSCNRATSLMTCAPRLSAHSRPRRSTDPPRPAARLTRSSTLANMIVGLRGSPDQ